MNKLFLFVAMIGIFTACSKDDNPTAPYYLAPAGTADITLTTTESVEYKLSGPCGWAYAAGVGYIGANQTNNSLKTFSADTNLTALPTVTTTYTLTDDALDEDPTKIRLHLTEFTGGSNYISWDSYVGSGSLTLVVEGNKVTADLSGILLEADSSNAAPYNHNGTLSGTLTFYR